MLGLTVKSLLGGGHSPRVVVVIVLVGVVRVVLLRLPRRSLLLRLPLVAIARRHCSWKLLRRGLEVGGALVGARTAPLPLPHFSQKVVAQFAQERRIGKDLASPMPPCPLLISVATNRSSRTR